MLMMTLAVWLQVMEALKKLAEGGHTVVAAIHQPRSGIWDLFDDLLLLSQARLCQSDLIATFRIGVILGTCCAFGRLT